jgi:hypothetical protein
MLPTGVAAAENSHRWERETHEHYVEPLWCSQRLFQTVPFEGSIWDPACGFGRIPYNAYRAGHRDIFATDVVARGDGCRKEMNFLTADPVHYGAANIISNPPFDIFKEFALHALKLADRKVALIWLVRTLPAAHWLRDTPLAQILFLTPRPSMPPGHVISAGEKPGGGKQDFCWLVWDLQHKGDATAGWLHRDKA